MHRQGQSQWAQTTNRVIPQQGGQRGVQRRQAGAGPNTKSVSGPIHDKRPPRPKSPPPPKQTLLPKHVITIFGPESSGTTFLSTALGVATGAFTPEGKWSYTPGTQWSIPNDSHQFADKTRWVLEKTLGRRSMSPDGMWEIQHLSLPWGWFCEENEVTQIVEALVPEECWRYETDSHLSPKSAESVWYSAAKRKNKKLPFYSNPDNFESVEKIPHRQPEEEKYIGMCRNEVHITERNQDDSSEWTCGAKCGAGAYDGFALYPKRFSVNISSHIEWYLKRGVDVTAILSVRDRTISTKGKFQDHCKLSVGQEEDDVALQLMTEALEMYGKRGSNGAKERVLVVSYEGLMGIKQAHLFDLYHRLGINSTYVPEFKDGNAKYVTPYKKKRIPGRSLDKRFLDKSNPLDDFPEELRDNPEKNDEPPPKPRLYKPPPPRKHLLPKRIIAVFGTESSGTTFLANVLGVATGAFPEEGKWVQILAPNPQTSVDPTTPRMKWKFHKKVTERAVTTDGELELQHLSLPSGGVCQKEPELNELHVVEAYVPAECMRYEKLPDLDPKLAEQIWYNKHTQSPKRRLLPDTDTVSGYDWEEDVVSRKQLEQRFLEQCRNEVKISQQNDAPGSFWSCGAKCGEHKYDGFALYPNRYFVNVTSHIEWYLSRGVDITVVISMRDRSISSAAKNREHCHNQNFADQEDEMALSLIKTAIGRFGVRGKGEKERVITVSYEAMMEFKEAYLFDLYHQLGIDSSYVPEFTDGNAKYITDATKGELKRPGKFTPPERLTSADRGPPVRVKKTPPKDWKPRPPKKSILPKRVITVVGSESSGTTFLSTALGVAAGAFNSDGEWFEIFTFGRKTKQAVNQMDLDFSRDAVKKMDFKESVSRRVTSSDGVEIQHLSLPWGWLCDATTNVQIVEALVPEECFRYERGPNMDPHFAESYFWSEHAKRVKQQKLQLKRQQQQQQSSSHRLLSENNYFNNDDLAKLTKCRNQAMISEDNDTYTCGAKCGTGYYNGFALYPQRFSVNITSHIEWYLSRGVDITVIVSTRDTTISHKGKLKSHCQDTKTADEENKLAMELMTEALEKYGKHGSRLGLHPSDKTDKVRVITVSYEALMGMKESYLFGLYKYLGINSTYVPKFADGNIKYVTDRNEANLDPVTRKEQQEIEQMQKGMRPPKPSIILSPPQNTFFLPQRLITVFSLDSSRFLSTSIAAATGAFPRGGQWVQENTDLVFEDTIKKSARSPNGEIEIQHILLPSSATECDGNKVPVVEAIVPSECSRILYEGSQMKPPESSIAEQCRDEVFISEENNSADRFWSCGAECGSGEYDGYAIYPERYFVNISSHIEWYISRGVDVTAVLQVRDRSISKKSVVTGMDGCRSRVISQADDDIGLNIMKEAYQKYGIVENMDQTTKKRSSKGAERAIVVSYEGLMAFQKAYLLEIYQQLGIRSSYMPAFIDENAKYIRTPPPVKKISALNKSGALGFFDAKRGGLAHKSRETQLQQKPNERVHVKYSEENYVE
ncbi:hypothetical protein HJC23_001144 [Cyclotella cryptica]|uniref:Uncharacterized protein n=1 Tax=Cyclotella cryptica TaxID=29204 RepID=A0ABD3P587_9STRA